MASKLAQSQAKRGERPRYLKRHSDDSMGLTEAEIGSIRNARRRPSDVDAFRSSLDRRGSQKILSNVIGKWVSGMRNSTVLSLDSDDSVSFSNTMLNLDDHDGKLQGSSTQDFCNWEGFDRGTVEKNRRQRKTLIQSVETNPVSDEVRRLAAESYQEMVKNDTYGDACLVQKCYIMIGTRPAEQSLIFCALQQIVDLEREVSDKRCNRTLCSQSLYCSQFTIMRNNISPSPCVCPVYSFVLVLCFLAGPCRQPAVVAGVSRATKLIQRFPQRKRPPQLSHTLDLSHTLETWVIVRTPQLISPALLLFGKQTFHPDGSSDKAAAFTSRSPSETTKGNATVQERLS